jgi:hypothetical protein
LSRANGGHPELSVIEGPSGVYAIDTFFHLLDHDTGPDSLWSAMRSWRPVLGINAVPFAIDPGGNPFFLDLSEHPAPVRICLHDEQYRTVDVAASLADLIGRLRTDPDLI